MGDFLKRYGKWALLAGAAEGLGEAFCHALAEKKVNIILVDKEPESMEQLARKLEDKAGIETRCLHLDLGNREAAKEMMTEIEGLDCRLLIYNAAYSQVRTFLNHPVDELDNYIDVNCRTMIKIVHGFASHLQKYSSGGILLMSSLAGLWGTQLVSPYGASKAFTLNLAEALYHELKSQQIDVMACIAGATATPAYLSTKPQYGIFKPSVLKPEKVATYAVNQLGRKAYCIPGSYNKLSYFLMNRIFPRKSAGRMINSTMGKMYKEILESQR